MRVCVCVRRKANGAKRVEIKRWVMRTKEGGDGSGQRAGGEMEWDGGPGGQVGCCLGNRLIGKNVSSCRQCKEWKREVCAP